MECIPVKDLLLLLRTDALVLEQQIQERAFGFLQARVDARLEIPQIGEDALLELLHVAHRATERLEAKHQRPNDIGTGDVVEAAPEHTGHVLAVGQYEAVERWMRKCWRCRGR